MSQISIGKLFAKALKKEGIDAIFTLSGGHIMPILYACRDEGIRVIDVRHECSGAYAAIAYAKITGKPGVIVTTAGPGVTNVQTAMAEAAETSVPLIHIGGASPLSQNEMGPMQNIDSMKSMEAFCKWSRKIYQGNRAAEYVSMAFRQALTGTPGPVYLEIAADTVGGMCDEDAVVWPEHYRPTQSAYGNAALIEEAADALIAAKKPVLVLGQVAPYCSEEPEVIKELAEYLNIPVFAQMESRGMFGDELKDKLFTIGEGAIGIADVIVELGVDRNYKIGMGKPPRMNADAKRIVVHPDGAKIGWNWSADIAIVAGVTNAAKQILEVVPSPPLHGPKRQKPLPLPSVPATPKQKPQRWSPAIPADAQQKWPSSSQKKLPIGTSSPTAATPPAGWTPWHTPPIAARSSVTALWAPSAPAKVRPSALGQLTASPSCTSPVTAASASTWANGTPISATASPSSASSATTPLGA